VQAVETDFFSGRIGGPSTLKGVSKPSKISRAISDVLTGAYKEERKTQDVIAEQADIPLVTLQKKLAGNSPISATDLVLIADAIGVDAGEVLNRARAKVAKSEAAGNVTQLRPSQMTDEQLEELPNAANTDPEHMGDEADPA
jgi:transcriptional regulator with XRE-family HTH domain